MAIVRAIASGNWSNTAIWNTGALPTSADNVYSNTFTVTIDVSPTVLSIRNSSTTGVTAGGKFVINTSGIVLSANVFGQNTASTPVAYCLEVSLTSGQSVAINGNITAGGGGNTNGMALLTVGSVTITGACVGTSGGLGVYNNSSGTINIIGSCTSGTSGGTAGFCSGVYNAANGTVNITGSCNGSTSSPATSSSPGAYNASIGTINVNGDCTGGNTGSASGVVNASSGVVSINGTVTGGSSGPGVSNISNGTVSVTGSINAGSAVGFNNTSTGRVTHTGTATPSTTAHAISSSSYSATVILTGPFNTNVNGLHAVFCPNWKWLDTSPPSTYYQLRTSNLATIRPLYTADYVGGNPGISSVRLGTVYGPSNELTGTMAIPPASSVASGVPVDNTTGTAALNIADIWNYPITGITTSGSIGERLKTAATVSAVNSILSNGLR